MSQSKVKTLWGRKFNVVKEGLDEKQVVEFVDEIIGQRDTLLAERRSLLSYIRPYKTNVEKEHKPAGNPGQEAKNMTAEAVTEAGQAAQPEAEATEPEKTRPPVPLGAAGAEVSIDEASLYQGEVELVIPPPVDAVKLLRFTRRLVDSLNLKIVSTEGSQSKGSLIIVLLDEPQPLLQSLRQMPEVEEAIKESDALSQATEIPSWRFTSNQRGKIWVTLSKGQLQD